MTPPLHNPALVPPVGATAPAAPRPAAAPAAPKGASFAEVLKQREACSGVQFSGHALDRVQRRGIDTSPQTLQRLDGAVQRAAAKGARESVVLLDGTAFVVSVRNKTVITAVDAQSMREHVFTNIDSAVIA
jgi:flagellar operon protein